MVAAKGPFKLTPIQANLISLLLVGTAMAALLVILIGDHNAAFRLMVLGGMLAIGLGVAIFVRPQLGAYILAVSVFTNMSSILIEQGFPGITKPLVALVFLGVLANRLLSRDLPGLKRSEWLLLVYGGIWLASSLVANDRDIALRRVADFVKDFVILLCIVYPLESRPGAWKRAVWLVILSAGVLAAIAAYQAVTGHTEQTFFGFSKFVHAQIVENVDDGRLIGPLDDPNYFGQILVAVLPLALYRVLDERKLMLKLLALATALFLVMAILNTYSRGAFLAMVLVLILIAIERRIRPSLVLLVALSSAVIIPFLPARFTDRLETLSIFTDREASVHSEVSFRGRTSEMLVGVRMATDHPLLGVGIGNYAVNYQDYASQLGLEHRTEDRQAHSLYLEMAAETGMLGVLAFTAVFAAVLLGLNRARGKLNMLPEYRQWPGWITSVQMSIVAYLASSIFLHNDYIRYLWLFVALAMAMIRLADKLSANTWHLGAKGDT
jgi:O-antigen ligase